MSRSYTARPRQPKSRRRKVLVTGAAGNIGSYFAKNAGRRYELRLMVRDDSEARKIAQYGEVVQADLADLNQLKNICRGIDTVVHLAADPDAGASWDSLLPANIIGTYNMLVAAKAARCRRLIYASSIHAISGYPADVQVKAADPVNPGDLYGVSKCFGEAMCRYMAEQEGLSTIALRIGAFQPRESAQHEQSLSMLDAWVSRRDLNQLIERCIDVDDLQFAIFHGLSDNRFKRMDISNARELVGYAPQDDLTEENPLLKPLGLKRKVTAHSQRDSGTKSGIRNQVK